MGEEKWEEVDGWLRDSEKGRKVGRDGEMRGRNGGRNEEMKDDGG